MRRFIRSLFILMGLVYFTQCRPELKQNFSNDLEEKLNYAVKNFEPRNKAFILNVKTPAKETIFQIVHRSYAQQTRHENDSFGFALQLTFPDNNARDAKAYEKFKTTTLLPDFVFYKYQDIPCYIIDLDKDIAKTKQLTEKLLTEVYTFEQIQQMTVEMTDEGEVRNWTQPQQ